MHGDGHTGPIVAIRAEENRMRRTQRQTNQKGRRSDSPLQFGHAVELVVVAASEALSKGIVLDLQLRNLIAKTEKALKL